MSKFGPIILPAFVLSAMLLLFAGCGDEDDGDGAGRSSAQLAAETVDCNVTTNSIRTQGAAGLTYEASIAEQGAEEWCSFDLMSSGQAAVTRTAGEVGHTIFLYLRKNTDDRDRTASVRVDFSDGYSASFTLTQRAYSASAGYDRSWGEQPFYSVDDDYIHKTYYTTLSDGRQVRNYSVCYDKGRHVSRWVAYPLHKTYWTGRSYQVGSSTQGRTDAWAYDDSQTEYQSGRPYYRVTGRNVTQPAIAESDQQYIFSGYGAGGYQRGHMLASAARYNTWTTNAQTFYATNMMPQNGSLNGGKWANLENEERTWAGTGRYDTLYVVTGASFKDSKTIPNRNGAIAVPTHCWKVMLQARKGFRDKPIAECSADELRAIGFVFTNDAAGASTTLRQAARTVSEVEELSGFEFFRNLSPEAAVVKERFAPEEWGL